MKSYKDIPKYIAQHPKKVQLLLRTIRATIIKELDEHEEKISYGIPTIRYKGKNLLHFAGYEHHIGFYPGAKAIEVFKQDLTKYETSKGTIRFDLDKPIPFELIKRITLFRMKMIKGDLDSYKTAISKKRRKKKK